MRSRLLISCFALISTAATAQVQFTDPLTSSTTGVQNGGAFVSGGGWQAGRQVKWDLGAALTRKGVIHSFTASLSLAEFCLAEGFSLGFNGIATFNRADNVREVVAATPVTQLLLETDAPYLTPVPYRGRPNAPYFLPLIAEAVAGIKKLDIEELLDCLFHIAESNGEVTASETEYLAEVARIFGIDARDFEALREAQRGPDDADPWRVLGIARDADEETARKAWRELVRTHHPDVLTGQGMPPEFVALANERLSVINAAWDKVRKGKGWK